MYMVKVQRVYLILACRGAMDDLHIIHDLFEPSPSLKIKVFNMFMGLKV